MMILMYEQTRMTLATTTTKRMTTMMEMTMTIKQKCFGATPGSNLTGTITTKSS